jgi:hypothetical protein
LWGQAALARPGELDDRVAPIVYRYEHTLLVLPNLGEHVLEWADAQLGRVTAIVSSRDPRAVNPPTLPALAPLEYAPAEAYESLRERLPDGVAYLRQREALLEEARRDNAASRQRRSWPISNRSRA